MGNKKIVIHKNTQLPYLLMFMIAFSDQYVMLILANKVAASVFKNIISGAVLLYGLWVILYLFKFNEIIANLMKKKAWDVWIVFILVIISVAAFYINNWKARMVVPQDSAIRLLLFSFPIYLMARSILDYNYISERLWIIAYVYFGFCVLTMSMSSALSVQQGYNTNMVKGYQFGLCTLIWFENYFHSSTKTTLNKLNLVFGCISFLLVIAYGSRGTLLVCFAFIVAISLEKILCEGVSKYIILIALLVLIIYLFKGQLISYLTDLFSKLGFNSRTIAWLTMADSSLDSSGRDSLYLDAIVAIKNNPIFGYGILGDRMLLGLYVHNIFLEILLDFGVIIGGYISIKMIICSIKSYICLYTRRISVIIIFAMVSLMVSGSFLHNGAFWLALGIMLNSGKQYVIRK